MSFPKVQRGISAIFIRQFLLDYIGLYCNSKVICLRRKVSGSMIIHVILFKRAVAGIAPEDRSHTKLMCAVKCFGDLNDLAARFGRAEIDGGSNGHGSEVPGVLHRTEHDLVEFIRI